MKLPFLPTQGSRLAEKVDALYLGLCAISLIYMVIIFVPMIYFCFKYRRGNKANRSPWRVKTWKVEIIWTIIPFLMLVGFFGWSATLYYEIERPPVSGLEATVVGKQWMWKIQHAEGVREINELHVPLGETIKLTMTSEDVIHSFFLPSFRVKQDVVPGRYVTEWFKPTQTGKFHIFCAEFCGSDHSMMGGTVTVMTKPEYQAWLSRGAANGSLATQGEKLFRAVGCSGCHENSSVVRAPRLEGVYGRPVALSDGSIVTADERYLRDCILLQAQRPAGYEPVMPVYKGQLGEEELFQIIAYIKSLADKSPNNFP